MNAPQAPLQDVDRLSDTLLPHLEAVSRLQHCATTGALVWKFVLLAPVHIDWEEARGRLRTWSEQTGQPLDQTEAAVRLHLGSGPALSGQSDTEGLQLLAIATLVLPGDLQRRMILLSTRRVCFLRSLEPSRPKGRGRVCPHRKAWMNVIARYCDEHKLQSFRVRFNYALQQAEVETAIGIRAVRLIRAGRQEIELLSGLEPAVAQKIIDMEHPDRNAISHLQARLQAHFERQPT